jgi:hypothetical protein
MGRAAVRQAVAEYLSTAGITNLGTVFQHPPKFTPEGDFVANNDPGHTSGAVIFVHLREQSERRIALGGPTSGLKMRAYSVGLVCVFRSKTADTQDVGAENDAFLDSLVEAILANRNAGAPDAVFQWGEGDDVGEADVHVSAEMPRPLRLQASQVFSVVEVTALELVNH